MREEELVDLIRKVQRRQSEFQNTELKAASVDFPKRIYDTLSSFSNQDDGGVIIFGISERDGYEVTGVYDVENAQKKAMEACEQMEPSVRAIFTSAEVDGKIVLAAEIPSVEYWLRPVFYKGVGRLKGSYVRVGDADEPMSEYEIYSYEAFRRRTREDLRVVPECGMDMLDQNRIKQCLDAAKRNRVRLKSLPDEQIMELLGMTVNKVPTLASVLTFAVYPQAWFPQLSIIAVSLPGTKMGETDEDGARFIDNLRITGTISDMLDEATSFVKKNMRTKTIIDNNGKRRDKDEYPIIAVREAILNALIHRDYSLLTESSPITIEMYRNRMEIVSKGGLYGGGSVNMLGEGRPETRNTTLINLLELIDVTENRYSGIPTMRREMERANLPSPQFKEGRGEFRVIFWNGNENLGNDVDKSDILSAVMRFCSVPRSRDELAAFCQRSRYTTMSTIVQPLINQGKLMETIPEKPKSKNQRYVARDL